ncbi:major capsid protein [Methylorubrum extorquens]
MPEILDIFNQDAFSAAALTGNITIVPNSYGRINELGIFRPEPIATTSVIVIIEDGVLNLLPTRPRRWPGLARHARQAASEVVRLGAAHPA